MDFEGEPRLVEDKEDNTERTTNISDIKVENNGSCDNEDLKSDVHLEMKTPAEINGKDLGAEKPEGTLIKSTESPSGVSGGSPPTTKGYGLKKWKRIRRGFTKDGDNSVDLNRILKRGLSNAAERTKQQDLSAEIKPKSEGSVASANSSVKFLGNPGVFVFKEPSSDSRFAAGSAFPVISDSENSEDRSSKSSTAASAPKYGYDMAPVMGSARDKSRVKNHSGKGSGAVQRAQQGKGRIETSKKLRGERLKVEKENSYSSMESDSRSSNIGSTQMHSFSGNGNGRQSERLLNYDGQNSDEAQESELQSCEEVQTGYHQDNGAEVEYISQDDAAASVSWEVKEGKANHRPSTSRCPLLESIITLQGVQEALEKEIQIFGEIGKEHVSILGDFTHSLSSRMELSSIDPEIYESNSFGDLHFEEFLEYNLVKLKQMVDLLEHRLEVALATLKTKESRVIELQTIINRSESPKKESASTPQSSDTCREFERELEDLFMEKIEAEIEYLAITRTSQNIKVSLFEEEYQIQMRKKLKDAESNGGVLKEEVENLEEYCGDLLGSGEVWKMQNRVCDYIVCFSLQLFFLFLAFWLFLLQLLPHSIEVVPT